MLAVMVLGDDALLLAQVERVGRPTSEPVVDVFGVGSELPCLPSVLIGPAECDEAWHETGAGPRLRVRVAATAYLLAPYGRRD